MSKPFGTGTDILLQQFKGFLKKQRTHNFQAHTEETYTGSPSPKYLLASLWYDDSLIVGLEQYSDFYSIYTLIQELSDYFSGSLIYHITHGSLDDKEKQYLLEGQLRREHQFGELNNEKKALMLSSFLQKQLHTMERIILKSKQLSDEQKQAIINKVRLTKKR